MSKKSRMLLRFFLSITGWKIKYLALSRGLNCCCCLRPLHSPLLFPCLQSRKYTNDVAKIYSINVTNVMNGVASYCRPCALEASDVGSSCTSCPAGYYIDRDSGTCHSCPANTILKAHKPYGVQACVPCGPGTKNNKVPAVWHLS